MERLKSLWKDRPVFVTGATGLVGSWLVKELLKKQSRVVALVKDLDPQSELVRSGDIRRVTVVNGDLENISVLKHALNHYDIDTVFHLGAQTIVGAATRLPLETFESNIRGTYNVLESCRIFKDSVKRIIFASSDKAYGDQTKLPYTEAMSLDGRYPYDVSKSCADMLARSYFATYRLPVVITRCGNIYGGGDLNWSRIVPGTIRSLLGNERPVIRSDGKFKRDYLYVKDVATAYLAIAECLQKKPAIAGEAFNISADVPLTVLELVGKIQKLTKSAHLKPKILNTAQREIRSQYLSCAKLHRTLSWKPAFTLEQGLAETIAWYDDLLSQ